MKYKFRIIETYSKVVVVEAENMDSAHEKVEEMINTEEIALTDDDFEDIEIYPYGNQNK
ncbi:DpnD/PcfM family protein [Barnesiella intestinihominis]|jgi:hypothetical protein|uniref:DpnD/PcfM family protein n=1 Tax=Barnesiella intestinihominis TaxID=487174 RepID=UPI00242F14DC|nr:DpnD/PcfM family protein [Barnesiella intestinihominis]